MTLAEMYTFSLSEVEGEDWQYAIVLLFSTNPMNKPKLKTKNVY